MRGAARLERRARVRDIVETVSSGASLFATFRSTYCDAVDPVDVGRFLTEQTELWLRRAEPFRASEHAASETLVDVDYAELVRDTPATLRRIYSAAQLEAPKDLAAMIDSYHAAAPRGERGARLPSRGLRPRPGVAARALRLGAEVGRSPSDLLEKSPWRHGSSARLD